MADLERTRSSPYPACISSDRLDSLASSSLSRCDAVVADVHRPGPAPVTRFLAPPAITGRISTQTHTYTSVRLPNTIIVLTTSSDDHPSLPLVRPNAARVRVRQSAPGPVRVQSKPGDTLHPLPPSTLTRGTADPPRLRRRRLVSDPRLDPAVERGPRGRRVRHRIARPARNRGCSARGGRRRGNVGAVYRRGCENGGL